MKISNNGLNFIKRFEGCRLTAYKCVKTEKYYTIGYGHYGEDVSSGMTISQAQADAFLAADLAKFEGYVNKTALSFNQNQFDALVSFTYNCGNGNLKRLVSGRTHTEIADAILLYDKSGGKKLGGLVKRRAAERELFNKGQAVMERFVIGCNYTLQNNMYIRDSAGGNKKLYANLTENAKSHAIQDADNYGILKMGTVVTCKGVEVRDGVTWVQIPSGWISGIGANGIVYMK